MEKVAALEEAQAPRYSIYPGKTQFALDQSGRKRPPKFVDQRKILRYLNLNESESSDESDESSDLTRLQSINY